MWHTLILDWQLTKWIFIHKIWDVPLKLYGEKSRVLSWICVSIIPVSCLLCTVCAWLFLILWLKSLAKHHLRGKRPILVHSPTWWRTPCFGSWRQLVTLHLPLRSWERWMYMLRYPAQGTLPPSFKVGLPYIILIKLINIISHRQAQRLAS